MSPPRQPESTGNEAGLSARPVAEPSNSEKSKVERDGPGNMQDVGNQDHEPATYTAMNDKSVAEATVSGNRAVEAVDPGTMPINSGTDIRMDGINGPTLTVQSAGDAAETAEPTASSIATLKAEPRGTLIDTDERSSLLPPKIYLDPTPKTPGPSLPVSRSSSNAALITQNRRSEDRPERSPTRSDAGFDERPSQSDNEKEADAKSEIQSIMDQFGEDGGGPGEEEVMSPRLEFANPLLSSPHPHPPRKSSLEPINSAAAKAAQGLDDLHLSPVRSRSSNLIDLDEKGPEVPPKPASIRSFGRARNDRTPRIGNLETPTSPPPASLHRPPPPEPEPESDLPFDFHRFLEQLRHRTADPVAKFLRSFLQEFGKKQWMVHEQVKIISDFLAFITNKMAQCEVWRDVSDAEFDNAREGMEKLVMNRLYSQTFSPAIPPPQSLSGPKSKRKSVERSVGPGRRGQHQEDVERDEILAQKVSIYGWIKEEHLDIPPVGDSGKRFLLLAQQELLKMKTYRAPRDKIICVLNCCKVIFGLLKHSKSDSSADSFMPLLIYVVLQANPEHLVSNVQYILRFRNQEKLAGEAGYYLSSLMGAIQFIEGLDRTSLTISDEEFEANVEAAVSTIAEKHAMESPPPISPTPPPSLDNKLPSSRRPEDASRRSNEGSSSATRRSNENESSDAQDEKAAMGSLFRTIQKPLSTIGRIFSEDGSAQTQSQTGPARTPLPGNTPRLSPVPRGSYDRSDRPRSPLRNPTGMSGEEANRGRMSAEDAAARQASAEAAEARRIQQAEHANVVETLAGMFPDLDREIISDVVVQHNGRVGLAVDACLALSA